MGASRGPGWAGAPLHPPPYWVSHGLGMEMPGNAIPKNPGCPSGASPAALLALGTGEEQKVGASGTAGDFQGQESHQKKLKSSNSASQGRFSLGAGKRGAQAGTGMSPEHRWRPSESLSTKVPPPLPSPSSFQLSRFSALTADNLQAHVKPPSTVSLIIPSINDKSHSFQGSHYEFIPLFNVLTNSRHPAARGEILNNPFWKSRADTAGAILDSGREMGQAGGIGL